MFCKGDEKLGYYAEEANPEYKPHLPFLSDGIFCF